MVVGAALAVLGLPQEAVPASLAVLPPSVFDSDIPQADRDSVLASSANDPELELAKLAVVSVYLVHKRGASQSDQVGEPGGW